MTLLYVALGGALGAPVRYVVAHLLDGPAHRGTLAVNLVGSFLLGLFSGLALTGDTLAFLGTGFCGALTTYSSFTVHTYHRGPGPGAVDAALTVVPAVLLCALGFLLGAS